MIQDNTYKPKKEFFITGQTLIKENTIKQSLLHHKTSRRKSEQSCITGRRCDICLEFEKYSPQNLIECTECGAICHEDCYSNDCRSKTTAFLMKTTSIDWICFRCRHAKILNRPIQNFCCGICGEYEGIVQKLNQCEEYYHNRCLRYISEVYSVESSLMDFSIECTHTISVKSALRKWREKNMCKICKERDFNGKHVIKCANTKCKSYFHIPCAIAKNLIFSLDFQYDYYGFCAEGKKKVSLPFYCTSHNKSIADAYKEYTKQLDLVMNETEAEKKEYDGLANSIKDYRTEDETKEDLSHISNLPCTNCENIYNLHHPEFNFDSSQRIRDSVIEEEPLDTGKVIQTMPQKPRYENEDTFTFNFCENMNADCTNYVNSLHFENDFNSGDQSKMMEKVSRLACEFLENDGEILNKKSLSYVPISEIKDLKAFFLTILSNCPNFYSPPEEPKTHEY